MCGTPHRSRRTSTTLSRPGTVMAPSSCARRPRAESSSSAREGSWADNSAGRTKLQSAGLIMERERLREVSQPAPTPGTPPRSRGSPLGHFGPRGTAPRSQLPFNGRHLDAGYSAWHDAPELGEVGGHVQREPMPGDPLLHVDPDARDLPVPSPHAGVTRIPRGGYAEPGERVDQRLLEGAEVPVEVPLVTGQVDDRVADELAGSVERHVPAALDLEDPDAIPAAAMPRIGVAAQRPHRGVFAQQQHVVRQPALDAGLAAGPLPLERLGVRDHAGLHDFENPAGHDAALPRSAQRLPAMPSATLPAVSRTMPSNCRKCHTGAARMPRKKVPNTDRVLMTPRCHIFSRP